MWDLTIYPLRATRSRVHIAKLNLALNMEPVFPEGVVGVILLHGVLGS